MQRFIGEAPEKIIDSSTTLFWLRRDLRLEDNAGLFHALNENSTVLALFIFDTVILERLEDKKDARVEFILQSLLILKAALEKLGTSLFVYHGNPTEFFKRVNPRSVYANHDYEPYARQRDNEVQQILAKREIAFKTYKDQVIFDRDEIIKADGSPYTVYTPYSRKWKATLTPSHIENYDTRHLFDHFKKIAPLKFPTLSDLGFGKSGIVFPERTIKRSVIEKYHLQRDFPAIDSTSRLSVHLRFGTVSIRMLVQVAIAINEKWLNELIWRDFYHMILWHFPHVATKSFKPAYDHIPWRTDLTEFSAWCKGQTGYAIVDAGMRELNATGFMHNRVRMITASFLAKHLLIDWRWGEAYFAKKLLDFDLAANNGGWQWTVGSGCDAVPYFRVFNPMLQAEKFDPDQRYVRKWVPELGTPQYPKPIVDHAVARDRALKIFKAALST